jgi:hypothetical protein
MSVVLMHCIVHINSFLEYNITHFIVFPVEGVCPARDFHHFVLCLSQPVFTARDPLHLIDVVSATLIHNLFFSD